MKCLTGLNGVEYLKHFFQYFQQLTNEPTRGAFLNISDDDHTTPESLSTQHVTTTCYIFINSLALLANIAHIVLIHRMPKRSVRFGNFHYNQFVVIVGIMDLLISLERLFFTYEIVYQASITIGALRVVSAVIYQSLLYSQAALMVVISVDRLFHQYAKLLGTVPSKAFWTVGRYGNHCAFHLFHCIGQCLPIKPIHPWPDWTLRNELR